MKSDSMKIRKTFLWLMLAVLLFFGNCTTYETLNFDGYNFQNNDDIEIRSFGETWANPYFMLGDAEIDFQLYTKYHVIKGNRYRRGGNYQLSFDVVPAPHQFIKTVTLNKVTIQAGDNVYDMIKGIYEISPNFIREDEKRTRIYKRLSKKEIEIVCSNGIIDIEAYKEKFDDLHDTKLGSVSFDFVPAPIDETRYKEIFVRFDITLEYTTGETIRQDQEFYGLYEIRRKRIYRPLFTV
jgi:hypothetical protein